MRTLYRLFITIVILAILAAIAYAAYLAYPLFAKKNTQPPLPGSMSTSTPSMASSTAPWQFTPSTADRSSWKTYSNSELGYQISYPGDLSVSAGTSSLILTFPKATYYHWPLLDDARVTVIAESLCPGLLVTEVPRMASSTFSLSGYNFRYIEGDGAAAGNRYHENVYMTKKDGVCYQIGFFNHGTNGAGFYVDDQSLIAQYDAQHDADAQIVMNIVSGLVESFKLR